MLTCWIGKKVQDQYPKALSGGERQRATIARALYNNQALVAPMSRRQSWRIWACLPVTAEMLAATAYMNKVKGVVMNYAWHSSSW